MLLSDLNAKFKLLPSRKEPKINEKIKKEACETELNCLVYFKSIFLRKVRILASE